MAKYPTPIIASFGEEEFFIDRDMRSMMADTARFLVRLDGSDLTDRDLIGACEAYDIDATPRLVLVDNAEAYKPDKTMKAFIAGLDPSNLFSVLGLFFRTDKLPAFWAKVDPQCIRRREHRKLKTYDNDNEVIGFISSEGKKAGLRLDGFASAIYRATGPDLYRIVNEIGKLALIAGNGPVTQEHLDTTLTSSVGVDVWAVIDAAGFRNLRAAMDGISSLYQYASEDPGIPMVYALHRQIERMVIVAAMLSRGASDEEIAGKVGLHVYRCKSHLIPMVRKHTLSGLVQYMQSLCTLDVEAKRATPVARRVLLELALMRLVSAEKPK